MAASVNLGSGWVTDKNMSIMRILVVGSKNCHTWKLVIFEKGQLMGESVD